MNFIIIYLELWAFFWFLFYQLHLNYVIISRTSVTPLELEKRIPYISRWHTIMLWSSPVLLTFFCIVFLCFRKVIWFIPRFNFKIKVWSVGEPYPRFYLPSKKLFYWNMQYGWMTLAQLKDLSKSDRITASYLSILTALRKENWI